MKRHELDDVDRQILDALEKGQPIILVHVKHLNKRLEWLMDNGYLEPARSFRKLGLLRPTEEVELCSNFR